MTIAIALLVSTDPTTIHLFSHALHGLSLSTNLCQDGTAAIRLLNRQKFDAVIVDLELGEQSGAILDELHVSSSTGRL